LFWKKNLKVALSKVANICIFLFVFMKEQLDEQITHLTFSVLQEIKNILLIFILKGSFQEQTFAANTVKLGIQQLHCGKNNVNLVKNNCFGGKRGCKMALYL
jgi:hypothetical protein